MWRTVKQLDKGRRASVWQSLKTEDEGSFHSTCRDEPTHSMSSSQATSRWLHPQDRGWAQWPTEWKWKSLSRVRLFGTPWTIQSMEFSRPEYWSGLSLLQGIFPTQELNRVSCIAGRFFTNRAIREGRPTYVMPKFVTQKLGGWQVILCCRAIKLEGICFTAISSYRRCSSFGMQDSFCSFLSEITKIRNKSF